MSLTAQVLREVAARIRLGCRQQPCCAECADDAAILERIAARIVEGAARGAGAEGGQEDA